ncbi:PTR2-domain-containing protein [Tothia fuscella]|uniref:PTR2-domain-containing protein n=1 Tax=Tothia fuscella TaxID=1048955 RepID=A0A9P4P4K2_9PEZI|nr:PTR2-domain-containing protein [Tothia fuscella]
MSKEQDAAAAHTDGEEPTLEEKHTLRHVGEYLPARVWLVAVVELCERFTYYGMQGLFQNYVSHKKDGSEGAKGLGLGHVGATGLNTFFQFWCYVTPLLGAVIADQYLGRYNTILIFCGVYMIGILVLTITSLPQFVGKGDIGIAGFATAVIIIGLGTGGIKSNVAPLIADQYKRKKMAISTTKTGERVILDPAITIQKIYMYFYMAINIGCLSLMATPFMEKYKGFWTAYLLCFCMFLAGTLLLVLGKKLYVVTPPQGSIITDAFKAIFMMIRARNMNAPKPSFQAQIGSTRTFNWDDKFIEELKRALVACKVFCVYPIYWVCYNQFSNNFISQADQMEGHGIPNDFMQNFDPVAIIVMIPILDHLVYPALRKAGIPFPPINRIVLGFWVVSCAMLYATIVQHFIYKAGPCYGHPGCIKDTNGVVVRNNIHIAIQTPAYILVGISEIFASVTGLEYAYTKAPPSMKSFVQALYLLTSAFGSALSEAFTPLVGDPTIMWLYCGLTVGAFLAGCFIWVVFHKYNDLEEEMNELGI